MAPPGIRLARAPRRTTSERRLACYALAAACAFACAHAPAYDFTPDGMRREIARRVVDLDPADVVVPFEVGEAEIARARAVLSDLPEGKDPVAALVDALSDPEVFGLHYEWATSGTAAETLERGAGNCLALSSTLIGIARGLGFRAHYLEVVVTDSRWRSEGDLAVQADHVAAMIDTGTHRLFVDFLGRLQRARRTRIVDDFEVLAHYYNNRGYELLHRAAGQGEPPWEGAARDFELATRVQPGHARAWNNLGVARARQGDDAAARVCYERALELEPEMQSPHLNLVTLHLRAGDLERAAYHLDIARRLDPRNPQLERLTDSLTSAGSSGS
jgi:tetratricopeptide (TPR) repeat protein